MLVEFIFLGCTTFSFGVKYDFHILTASCLLIVFSEPSFDVYFIEKSSICKVPKANCKSVKFQESEVIEAPKYLANAELFIFWVTIYAIAFSSSAGIEEVFAFSVDWGP